MDARDEWISQVRRDIGKLADGRPLTRRRRKQPEHADAVFVRWRYLQHPTLGELSWDVEQFDLAMRRAAYAAQHAIVVQDHDWRFTRLPRRAGLQLRGSAPGSLELLLDIPTWIVVALSSQPATALVNLITLIGARESVRIRLRQLVLTKEETELLESHTRPPAHLPPALDDVPHYEVPELLWSNPDHSPDVEVVRQGDVPDEVAERLAGVEPLVDVELPGVRVRSQRPELDIVVKQGDHVTAVSIREPRR